MSREFLVSSLDTLVDGALATCMDVCGIGTYLIDRLC
jgi:hypothetical protein